jgi:transcription antitermination factor NusG
MKVISNQKWYVLQTRSRFEKKCFEQLSLLGISVFLPMQKIKRKWSDRIKEIETPLFSGYLFIQFDEKDRYKILNTNGIVRFVSFSGIYATLSENQIETIRKIEKSETSPFFVTTFSSITKFFFKIINICFNIHSFRIIKFVSVKESDVVK